MSRATRARASRRKRRQSSRRLGVPVTIAAVVVALLALAFATTRDEPAPVPAGVEQFRPVAVLGAALPPMPRAGTNPAVGLALHTIEGHSFDGTPVRIGAFGRPTLVVQLAHWCPHCQADVPVFTRSLREVGLPPGVDVVALSTWADPARPNFPPSQWLAGEGWPVPTLADDAASSAATALGLSGTPTYLLADSAGTVRWRYAGEVPVDTLEQALAAVS